MAGPERIRPFVNRPPNRTIHPELRLAYFSDDYESACHLIVTTSKGEQEVLPMSDADVAHHFSQLARIVEHRFKQKMGLA